MAESTDPSTLELEDFDLGARELPGRVKLGGGGTPDDPVVWGCGGNVCGALPRSTLRRAQQRANIERDIEIHENMKGLVGNIVGGIWLAITDDRETLRKATQAGSAVDQLSAVAIATSPAGTSSATNLIRQLRASESVSNRPAIGFLRSKTGAGGESDRIKKVIRGVESQRDGLLVTDDFNILVELLRKEVR